MLKRPASLIAFVVSLFSAGILLQLPVMSGATLAHLAMTAALVGISAIAVVHYARHRTPEAEGKVDGALSLAAYFFLIGACLLAGSSVWRLFDRAEIRKHWQAVEANVDVCRLMSEFSDDAEDRHLYWGAECSFTHRDRGEIRKIGLRACCTAKAETARSWLKEYPRGQSVRLYLHPTLPETASLGGAEYALMWTSAERNAYTSFLFALAGALCWFLARWVTRGQLAEAET
jgi:hypothetical protein